jgi:transcriptional regulator with XRE-family HTH domain
MRGESSASPLCHTGTVPRELPEYHQRVADQNRTAIITASTALFVESGYDRTSLARVAERAGVSKATASRALNGRGEMSRETRDRVVAALRKEFGGHAVRATSD